MNIKIYSAARKSSYRDNHLGVTSCYGRYLNSLNCTISKKLWTPTINMT